MNRNRLLSLLSIVALAAAGSDCVDKSAKKCEKIAKRGKCAYEKRACAPPADKCAKKAEGKCKCKKKRCCAWTGAACAADPCAAHSKRGKCLRKGCAYAKKRCSSPAAGGLEESDEDPTELVETGVPPTPAPTPAPTP